VLDLRVVEQAGEGQVAAVARDPTVTLDRALTAIWRQVSAALGLPDEVPVE
jgi:hypothetical protein